MPKILHCADLHLDSPFQALSPEKAFIRRQEQKETVQSIVQLANDERVDFLLMAGDLFDGRDSFYDTVLFLSNELRKARCRVLISPGNHDHIGAGSPYQSVLWPENVHIFKSPQIERIEFPGISIYGAGFDSTYINRPILQDFCVRPSENAVMVLHGDTTTAGSPYNPITVSSIEKSGLIYLALGHVHAFSGIQKAGKTAYAYPGCTEGRGFDEQGEKGVLLGEVSEGAVDLRFVPLAKRKYREVQISVSGASSSDEWMSRIREAVSKESARDILRFVLTGETDIAADMAFLEKEFLEAAFSVTFFDKTRPMQNLWEAEGEDSLKGIFLKRMKERINRAKSAEERERAMLAASLGLAALTNSSMRLHEGEER